MVPSSVESQQLQRKENAFKKTDIYSMFISIEMSYTSLFPQLSGFIESVKTTGMIEKPVTTKDETGNYLKEILITSICETMYFEVN